MSLSETTQIPTSVAVVLWSLKVLAIVVGLVGSLLCVMATVALATSDLLYQLLPALVIIVITPLAVVERFSRDERGRRREGLASDLLAPLWLGFAVLFIAGAFPVTRPLLQREAELLRRSSSETVAQLAPAVAWVARSRPGRSISSTDESREATARPDFGVEPLPDLDASAEASIDEAGLEAGAGEADGDAEAAPLPILAPSALLDELSPALVTIAVRRLDGYEFSATGFFIDEQGMVATAASVVRGAHSVAIRQADGTWYEEVSLVARDMARGVALLSAADIERPVVAWVTLGEPESVEPGARLYVLTDPLGLGPTLADGELIQRFELNGQSRWQISAPISSVGVGGLIATERGEAVAIAVGNAPVRSLRPEGASPINVAAPISPLVLTPQQGPGLQLFGRGTPPPNRW